MDYEKLSDEALVDKAHKGDKFADEILYNRYKNMVRMKAHPYFLVGADKEDLIQEGMIGFYKATRDYDASHGASFYSFAELCITRQIITAIKTATRKKHMPLNTYVSIYKKIDENEGERSIADTLPQMQVESPEDTFIVKESLSVLLGRLADSLSPLEKEVLDLFLEGKSYTQIAQILSRSAKSIDNALQRIKKKVENLILADKE